MKLRQIKSAFAVGSLIVWIFFIATNVCLFNRKCYPDPTTIVSSLEWLSFQEPLGFLDYDKDNIDLPRGLNQHIWENNCVKTIETLCNFPVFPNAPDQRQVISRTEITAPKDAGTDGHRLFGFVL